MAQLCKSCGSTKGSEAFIHPTTLKQGKTCADCIMKRSAAASSRPASDVGATLTNHAARLDDHETRLAVVERTSSRADLAEWLELRDPAEPVGPGDLVECVDRKISREITGRGVLFIVSTEPFFTGNVPSDEVLPRGRAVAMIGQVPVKVRGAVRESQCLAASGEDDGTAVASDCPTGIVAMEAAETSESFRLVRALVNAGSHAIAAPELTKKQKRRRARWAARKQKKQRAADEFVLVAADDNSEATDETDLDSLASSHSCVRKLIEENKQLVAAMRGTRVLFRDPSLLQRVGRGFVARRRAAGILRAIVKIQAARRSHAARVSRAAVTIQAASRTSLEVARRHALLRSIVSLQSQVRVRQACAVLSHKHSVAASTTIASCVRCYLVLTTTVVGKLLSRTWLQAAELTAIKAQLAAAEKRIARHDEEIKNTIHAHAVRALPVYELPKSAALGTTDKVHELLPRVPDSVVAIHGSKCPGGWTEDGIKIWRSHEKYHRGTITKILDDGKYQVAMEKLTRGEGKDKRQSIWTVDASEIRFKVEVHGSYIKWSDQDRENFKDTRYHRGTIAEVLDDGEYQVQYDDLGPSLGSALPCFTNKAPPKAMRFV